MAYSLAVVHGLLTGGGSLVAEHRLYSAQASVVVGHRHNCLGGMWDHPRPGTESVSPAFTIIFFFNAFTTEPPGKPLLPFSIDTFQVHL